MIADISYLILNYNPEGESTAQEILASTIDTFYERKSKNLTCEVLLLDQGSPEKHRLWLLTKQNQYGFCLILLNNNIGISGAINFFARTAKSPVLALITSDVIITSGMDEDLFSKIQIPEIYQATPFTDKSDVDYQMWKPEEQFGSAHVDLTNLKKMRFFRKLVGSKNQEYVKCIGAELNVMFWKKATFSKIGYFDERWKACYENNDFSLRCFLNGGCTAISKGSFVWHYHKVTEKNRAREKAYENHRDWATELKKKWDEKWPDLNSYIDIYKPLGKKSIVDFPKLYSKFNQNIRLFYDENVDDI